jgi:hypothetical protein
MEHLIVTFFGMMGAVALLAYVIATAHGVLWLYKKLSGEGK